MTEVFQARPTNAPDSHPGYAIKTIVEDCLEESCSRALLCREALVLRQIRSAHVVPLLAANLHQSPQFIVMPYLPGASLAELLEGGVRPVLPVALWIARQVAEALDAICNAGWTHGDIKPSNVVVAPSGHVTLIDLGFARRLGPSTNESPTEHPLTGTLTYLAPELVTSALQADIRSDLYSLGVMLYELLTGRVPFSSSDPAELIRQHREEKPRELRIAMPNMPTRVRRLVHCLLAKDPARRPHSPHETSDRLKSLEVETFDLRLNEAASEIWA
jgi:serine/threonine-protein kinase